MLPSYLQPSAARLRGNTESYGGWVPNPGTDEHHLLTYEANAVVLASGEAGGSYEYDDADLIQLGDKYYITQTSGCSCPDPADTWGLEGVFSTVDEAANWLLTKFNVDYTDSYTELLKDMRAKNLTSREVPSKAPRGDF